ncbi:HEAT repeat domain-containing protein [Nostoc sp.]|uniref:HEAT repeat domain-containing protein n=1 Tax=Nostoc sp. TaxID=1180 RepID=UPI002FFD43D6
MGLVERKKQSKRQGDVSAERGSELYKETEITKTFEHDAFLDEVLKQNNTLKSKGKRIAIIGEPGAGKTTLLQQIADWVSREIHQSIVIWVSLADLRGKELKAYLFESWLTQVAEKTGKAEATKQLKDDFVALFNQNNVWLLLDGLDEMSASSGNPLTEIARQFREAGLISQARIVLTCRVNLWDGSINALDDFDIYRTLDFSYPEQVERFINSWFAAIPETGKQLCTALKKSGKERIRDLVKNPLRLMLLCLNWQSGDGKLPDTQAGLYQQFVDDFYKWKKDEFAINSDQRQQLNVKLGELAKEAIDKKVNRFRLQQDFVNRFLGDAEDENSLLKLALNRGWLNCIGIDEKRKSVYAFFHASFQEYFAAKAIDDWHFFLNHVPKNPSKGIYRIFEPQWKQTILLWLGRPDETLKHQQQQFIDALVNFKDGCRNFYKYRAYFLAAAAIVEFREYKADKIVTQIVKWTIYSRLIKEEASSALQQTDRTKVIAALVQLLQSTTMDDYTRWEAADSLGRIDPGNQTAIAALVQLLQSTTVSDSTRSLAADSLGRIDPGNQTAIAALVQLLQSITVSYFTRSLAADSLGRIGTDNQTAIAALVQLLQSITVDDGTRRLAAHSLGRIDPGNQTAIAALVQLLQSTTVSDETRRLAAHSLGTICTDNQTAIAALVKLLQSTTVSDSILRLAADSLSRIDPGNQIATAALVKLLQSTTVDYETRSQAADSLSRIGTDSQTAIAALVQLLQSTTVYYNTRRQAADSLGRIGTGNQTVIAALVQLLQSTTVDDETYRLAADSLGRIGTDNQTASVALVQLLQSTTVNYKTRRQAADSLGRIGTGNQTVIAALVQLLQSTTVDDETRRQAADSLDRIDSGNQTATAALVQLLQSTTMDDYTRWEAADSLGRIGTDNQTAIAALVQLLQSTTVDDYIRSMSTGNLQKILQDNEHRFEVVKALSGYLQLNDNCSSIIWKCAQNMRYPDFYRAWHQYNVATRTIQRQKILFTRIIQLFLH